MLSLVTYIKVWPESIFYKTRLQNPGCSDSKVFPIQNQSEISSIMFGWNVKFWNGLKKSLLYATVHRYAFLLCWHFRSTKRYEKKCTVSRNSKISNISSASQNKNVKLKYNIGHHTQVLYWYDFTETRNVTKTSAFVCEISNNSWRSILCPISSVF